MPDFTPAPSLVALSGLLRPRAAGSRALDLACGVGRNALYLADLGYRVDAWDVSDAALTRLRSEIARRAAEGSAPTVEPRRVDLDAAELAPGSYDLVLDFYFLDRRLFGPLAEALRPGGLLVIETLLDSSTDDVRHAARYRLARGELPRAFAGLDVLEHVENEKAATARLVARR